jgi:flagellar motility protein MotE (MotC chaperone)
MKRLLIVMVTFVLLGGGVGALWFFKVPPFGKPAKPHAKQAAKPADSTAETRETAPATTATETGAKEPAESPISTKTADKKPAKTIARPDAAKPTEEGLTRMAQVYEGMPVEEATTIMAKLPDTVVEPLLRRMDDKQVGKILSSFAPERAAKLTVAMTGEQTATPAQAAFEKR